MELLTQTLLQITRYVLPILIGFGSGVVISGAVVAFITILGVVPRLAQKTKTAEYIKWYESAIVLGGIFGTVSGLFNLFIPIGRPLVILVGLCIGIFYGVLAMSLAEVLNVIPILTRRGRVQKGMFFFVLAIALGKLTGSLLYALVPGFYYPGS